MLGKRANDLWGHEAQRRKGQKFDVSLPSFSWLKYAAFVHLQGIHTLLIAGCGQLNSSTIHASLHLNDLGKLVE